MSYQVLGTLIVGRYAGEDRAEMLDYNATSPFFFVEANEDLINEFYHLEDEVPKEPGIYALSVVLEYTPYETWEGEHDVDSEVIWMKVRKFNEKEEAAFRQYELGEPISDMVPFGESENGSSKDGVEQEGPAESSKA